MIEAAKTLRPKAQALAPQLHWREIAGMRDTIAHACFSIDMDTVWDPVWDPVETKVPEGLPAIENAQFP